MSKNKKPQSSKKQEASLVRSSAAEYLTFVAAAGSSETSVEMHPQALQRHVFKRG